MTPCCPTCPDGTLLEEDEGEFWCPAEERAVSYGEVREADDEWFAADEREDD